MSNVGILGIGLHLPPRVRKNDWWPAATVASWEEKNVRIKQKMMTELATTESEGHRKSLEAWIDELDDPFRHSIERRILGDDRVPSDMETEAARQAIDKAGLKLSDVDGLLVHSFVPDLISTNNACTVHHKLGLSEDCFTMSVEAACNSFLMPLTMAQAMIQSGQARYVVVVQSTALSRVLPYEESYSVLFGDGAAAVVLGPVANGYGILSHSHRTDGSMQGTLVIGVRGKRWYDEGPTCVFTENHPAAHRMFTVVPELQHIVACDALEKAHLKKSNIDFLACHQGTAWLRTVTQSILGIEHARTLDTFQLTGSLIGANCPFVMGIAEQEGKLKAGDAVLVSSGGSGITYSAMVIRWGVA